MILSVLSASSCFSRSGTFDTHTISSMLSQLYLCSGSMITTLPLLICPSCYNMKCGGNKMWWK